MAHFAIQVHSGRELSVVEKINHVSIKQKLTSVKRVFSTVQTAISLTTNGKRSERCKLPSYIFIELVTADSTEKHAGISKEIYHAIKGIPGVLSILKDSVPEQEMTDFTGGEELFVSLELHNVEPNEVTAIEAAEEIERLHNTVLGSDAPSVKEKFAKNLTGKYRARTVKKEEEPQKLPLLELAKRLIAKCRKVNPDAAVQEKEGAKIFRLFLPYTFLAEKLDLKSTKTESVRKEPRLFLENLLALC